MGRYADSVSRILLEQGRAQAEGQLGSGQAWGHMANQLGQIPAQLEQIRAQRQQEQIQEQDRQLRAQQVKQGQQRLDQEQAGIDAGKQKAFTAKQIHDAAEQAYGQIKDGNAEAVLSLLPPESRVMAEGWLGNVAKAKQERDAQGVALGKQTAQFIQANGYDPVTSATALKVLADVHPGAKDALEHVTDPANFKKLIDHFATLGDKPEQPFKLGPGETQFSPEGQPIATGQPKPAAEPATIEAMLVQAIQAKDGPRVRELLNMKRGLAEAGRAPAAPKDEALVQIQGPTGAIWARKSDAEGKPAAQAARGVTGIERQSLAFFNRADEAAKTVAPLETKIAKMNLGSQARLQAAPNWLQSEENQSYRQAQRAFTEARLRKESGAAIPVQEYENDAKTYFAQPGDGPKILAQKQKARDTVLSGLAFSAGKAYDEFYGEPRPGSKVAGATVPRDTSASPAQPATNGPAIGSTVTFNGKRYKVAGITNGQADLEPL